MLVFHTPVLTDQLLPYSYRARATIPSKHIQESRVTADLKTVEQEDVVVLGKKHTLEDANFLKKNKIKFIVDIADHKFKYPKFEHWKQTILMANAVTTTCTTLGSVIVKNTKFKNSIVIPDPTERERKEASFKVKDTMTMCWYGADKNFEKLDFGLIQSELNKVHPTKFLLMTNRPKVLSSVNERERTYHWWLKDDSIRNIHLSIYDKVDNWSFEAQEDMINKSDIVLLPVTNDKEARCKGNNRPIDALQSGKFVLTNPGIPSYEILKNYISVDNLCKGYKHALENPKMINEMIKKGQEEIDKNYTPIAIANKWRQVYEDIMRNNVE